eukprot:3125491-Prymnesium_polylepis.1
MDLIAGMGPEPAAQERRNSLTTLRGPSTPGRRGFCIGSSMANDKEQAACFGDALKRSIKLLPQCSRSLDFFERPRFGNSTMALLRIKLVITPMRAEDT